MSSNIRSKSKTALLLVAHGSRREASNDEIRALTEYILAESKAGSIRKSVNKRQADSIYGTDLKYKAEVVVDNLEIPWGIEFLPDGDLLIAERNGTLSRFTGSISTFGDSTGCCDGCEPLFPSIAASSALSSRLSWLSRS